MEFKTKEDEIEHEAIENEEWDAAMLEDFIKEAIATLCEEDAPPEELKVRTYRQAGLLTNDRGLVVRIDNAEFQVTIVRSR